MAENTSGAERRCFSRTTFDAKVKLHQGADSWHVDLIDISLSGLAVSKPDDWDADYSQSFTAEVTHKTEGSIELYAHLVHVEGDSIGFQCEHIDSSNLTPLLNLLEQKIGAEVLKQEQVLLAEEELKD